MEIEPEARRSELQGATPDGGVTDAGPAPDAILKKTALGAGWIIGWRLATRLLGLVNTLILARILVPADFGLVALATGFVGALDALSGLGIENAIIQTNSRDRDVFDTGFTLNLVRAVLTCVLIVVAAEPAANFFHEPRITHILLALAISAFFSGFMNIGTVEFVRDMTFDKEFRLLVIPRVFAVAVTLSLGVVFRSYWALVAGILTGRLSKVGMSYLMHPYRPRLSLRSWRKIAGFSIWAWVLGLLGLIGGRTASFAIGRMLTVGAVGFYEVGFEIAWLPTSELIAPLGRACFPGFVAVRDSGRKTAETYLRIIGAMALFTLPAGVGISLVADPVVRLAFGPKWVSMVPVVEIFGLAGTMTVFSLVSTALLSAHGMLKSMAAVNVVMTTLSLIVIILSIEYWGLVGGAAGCAVTNVLQDMAYVMLASQRFGVASSSLLRCIWRGIAATIVMAAVMYGIGLGWTPAAGVPAALAVRMLEAVVFGAGLYSVALVGLWVLSGRPDGSEADLLSLALRIATRAVPPAWSRSGFSGPLKERN